MTLPTGAPGYIRESHDVRAVLAGHPFAREWANSFDLLSDSRLCTLVNHIGDQVVGRATCLRL
jgi:hypothetical protein